jgi:hypothetical protein
MVVTTFLMGLLPTYAEIGLAAPVLLSTLRILQEYFTRRRIYMIGVLFATATYYPLYLRLAGVKDVALVSFGVFVLILATAFTFGIPTRWRSSSPPESATPPCAWPST